MEPQHCHHISVSFVEKQSHIRVHRYQISWYNRNGINHLSPSRTNTHNKGLFWPSQCEVRQHFGLYMHMHARTVILMWFLLSCQRLICLHYHHMAGGSWSVRARSNSNVSLSGYKKQLHNLDVCHVTLPQDQKLWEGNSTSIKLHFQYFQREGWKCEWWLCLQSC